MDDFKLKIIISTLSAFVFSFIFILLAFVLPLDEETTVIKKPKNKLEKVSESFKNR